MLPKKCHHPGSNIVTIGAQTLNEKVSCRQTPRQPTSDKRRNDGVPCFAEVWDAVIVVIEGSTLFYVTSGRTANAVGGHRNAREVEESEGASKLSVFAINKGMQSTDSPVRFYLRRTLLKYGTKSFEVRQFVAEFCESGPVPVLQSEEGYYSHMCFSRWQQIALFRRFPDVVNVDGTLAMKHFDASSILSCSLFALFREMVSAQHRVKNFVMHNLAAQMRLVRFVFGFGVMLCYFHIRKAIKKHLLRRTDPRFVSCHTAHRLYITHKWTVHAQSGVVYFVTVTNNHLENANGRLKKLVYHLNTEACYTAENVDTYGIPGRTVLGFCASIKVRSKSLFADRLANIPAQLLDRPGAMEKNRLIHMRIHFGEKPEDRHRTAIRVHNLSSRRDDICASLHTSVAVISGQFIEFATNRQMSAHFYVECMGHQFATIFEISRYMYMRNALLLRLLKILRQLMTELIDENQVFFDYRIPFLKEDSCTAQTPKKCPACVTGGSFDRHKQNSYWVVFHVFGQTNRVTQEDRTPGSAMYCAYLNIVYRDE
ncbi:hypothetical protein CLF_110075 [Clonorchis sinensis]|uniref:Uncharacterized protein n=1 Tax=Clonorchis sinensis TaxID=79923 RepID=G7YT58_CLOSI|nr:hypothetical protein CLF_110075 [Clonorchis sinensis]